MNKEKDYYKILGITHETDKKDVKKAYRILARKFHPDINPGNQLCEEKFKEIGEAYSVLMDDKKRLQYDILKGFVTVKPQVEQAKKQASKAYSSTNPEKQNSDKNFSQSFEDVFKFFKKGINKDSSQQEQKKTEKKSQNETKNPNAKKGEDITTEVNITVAEAYNGTVRKVNILRTETCSKCGGKRTINNAPCPNCNGKGETSTHKQLLVKIPPKVKEGSKIRLALEGNKGLNGGENGDLFLIIHIIKNSYFTFDGLNVHCEVPITPSEAVLGAEIHVPSIDGYVNMKIPPETQTGQKFKISGEGLPDSHNGKRGDQIVTVKIEFPSGLNDKEKELYKELGELRKFNPRENMFK